MAQAQATGGGGGADHLGGVARAGLVAAVGGDRDRQPQRAHLVARQAVAEQPRRLEADVDAGVADASAVDLEQAISGQAAQAPFDGAVRGRGVDRREVDGGVELGRGGEQGVQPAEGHRPSRQPFELETAPRPAPPDHARGPAPPRPPGATRCRAGSGCARRRRGACPSPSPPGARARHASPSLRRTTASTSLRNAGTRGEQLRLVAAHRGVEAGGNAIPGVRAGVSGRPGASPPDHELQRRLERAEQPRHAVGAGRLRRRLERREVEWLERDRRDGGHRRRSGPRRGTAAGAAQPACAPHRAAGCRSRRRAPARRAPPGGRSPQRQVRGRRARQDDDGSPP